MVSYCRVIVYKLVLRPVIHIAQYGFILRPMNNIASYDLIIAQNHRTKYFFAGHNIISQIRNLRSYYAV